MNFPRPKYDAWFEALTQRLADEEAAFEAFCEDTNCDFDDPLAYEQYEQLRDDLYEPPEPDFDTDYRLIEVWEN